MGILFFNWYGYQLLTAYWQQQAENKLEAHLDQHDYDESQLISIKVPLTTLSYYNSSTTFERVNGQIEVNGVQYKYVQRRIFKDSLELRCIPNTTAMNLQKVKNEFFRQVNDLQQQTKGQKSNTTTTRDFSKDYTPTAMNYTIAATVTLLSPAGISPTVTQLPSRYTPTAELPPDQLLA